MSSMDALVCQAVGVLHLAQRPRAERAPAEVLVRIRQIGICGTDFHIFEGKHPFLAYPRVMGHELAAEVVEVPDGSRLRPDDVVVVIPYLSCGICRACLAGKPNCCARLEVLGVHRDGGMTEVMSLPEANLLPADGLTPDQCAAVEFLAIGAHAVRRGQATGGDRVLVAGAGPIGLGVALFARLAGAEVTVLDSVPERLAAVERILGIRSVILADAFAADRVSDVTAGDGFDLVFDATGNRAAMEAGFALVGHGGRYVLVGIVRDAIGFDDPDFHKKEMSLLGSRNATAVDFATVMDRMKAGLVPVDQLITHRTTLADATADLPRWAVEKTGLIKAMIEMG